MPPEQPTDSTETDSGFSIDRRAVLRAATGSAALGLGAGSVTAGGDDATSAAVDQSGVGDRQAATDGSVHPIFGLASAGPNPCMGDTGSDCLDQLDHDVDAEVELSIEVGGPAIAAGAQGVLSPRTTFSINEAIADGELDLGTLHKPRATVDVQGPEGGTVEVRVVDIAQALLGTLGFHFHPAGLHVTPGSTVLFSAETPDHAVAAYHGRHGRQNRVPEAAGPMSAPLVPVGGYWLARFDAPGVYDLYCPPHEIFGMVMRVVVAGENASPPEVRAEGRGRPPEDEQLIPHIAGGLDPNVPTAAEALDSPLLTPGNVMEAGSVDWAAVVDRHRSES